jgi:hypothetical protein
MATTMGTRGDSDSCGSLGTVEVVSAGTVDVVSLGTVDVVSAGTVDVVSAGTVDVVSLGTVDVVSLGTVDVVESTSDGSDTRLGSSATTSSRTSLTYSPRSSPWNAGGMASCTDEERTPRSVAAGGPVIDGAELVTDADELVVDELVVDEVVVEEVVVDEGVVDEGAVVSEEGGSGPVVSVSGSPAELVVRVCCTWRTNARRPADEEGLTSEPWARSASCGIASGSRWPPSLSSDPCGTMTPDRCRYSLSGTSGVRRTAANRALSCGSGSEDGRTDTMAAIAPASAPAVRIVLVMRFQ